MTKNTETALAVIAELIACKDLKDEELRLRQRRECSIARRPDALAKVNGMRDEYNRRSPIAWALARSLCGVHWDSAEEANIEASERGFVHGSRDWEAFVERREAELSAARRGMCGDIASDGGMCSRDQPVPSAGQEAVWDVFFVRPGMASEDVLTVTKIEDAEKQVHAALIRRIVPRFIDPAKRD